MGRRVNSFGYRLGITHFWKFQQQLTFPYKTYNILANNLLNQIIFSLFSYNGYKVLFCYVNSNKFKLFIDVKLLTSFYFESKKFILNNKLNLNFNIFLFNYYHYFFFLFNKVKILLNLINKLYYLIIMVCNINLLYNNYFFFSFFLLNYFLLNLFKLLKNINICLKKFYLIKNKFFFKNKNFYSCYKLNLVSKNIENQLRLLVIKKQIIINANFIYNIIPYFNKAIIKNLNSNFKNYWLLKRNLKIFEVIYFSCYFCLSNLLLDYIIDNLARKKKTHNNFLNLFFSIIESLYFQDVLFVSGIKISVFGKIDAKMRKQKISFFLGKLSLTSFTSKISFTQKNHETRFGVLGIRVWIKSGLLN